MKRAIQCPACRQGEDDGRAALLPSTAPGMHPIVVPEQLLASIAESEAEFCRRVRRCDPLEGARCLAAGYRHQLGLLESYVAGKPLAACRILEVGSGNGFFLCFALVNGLDIVGIEPGRSFGFAGRHERAASLLRANGVAGPESRLLDASAERLPFPDGSFDVVLCVAVLEHVSDVDASVREAVRVLRPGGTFIANVPNYNSWHEGHYDVPWIPGLGRSLAKRWVSTVYGRDPSFVDELTFTTPASFAKYLCLPGVSGAIYPHAEGALSRVFEAGNILARGAAPRRRSGLGGWLLRAAAEGPLRLPLRAGVHLLTWLLALFGFARTFDLVLRKGEGGG